MFLQMPREGTSLKETGRGYLPLPRDMVNASRNTKVFEYGWFCLQNNFVIEISTKPRKFTGIMMPQFLHNLETSFDQ